MSTACVEMMTMINLAKVVVCPPKDAKRFYTHVSVQLWRFLIPGSQTAGLRAPCIGDCHIAQQQSADDIV